MFFLPLACTFNLADTLNLSNKLPQTRQGSCHLDATLRYEEAEQHAQGARNRAANTERVARLSAPHGSRQTQGIQVTKLVKNSLPQLSKNRIKILS